MLPKPHFFYFPLWLFFVYSCSIFDLTFDIKYAIIVLDVINIRSDLFQTAPRLTTSLTIDAHRAQGNNGYRAAKEHFSRSGNGYKKPFAADRTVPALFGTQRSWVRIPSPRPSSPRPIGCKGIRTGSWSVSTPCFRMLFYTGLGRNWRAMVLVIV